MTALEILKKYYGYDAFRPGQREIIEGILEGRDALGIMPTGGGKSICYQVPALLLEGITVVISPLISLMKDQVDALKEYGIDAELINSTLSTNEYREIIMKAKEGAYKLIYVAPERLETESFMELMRELPIAMVAVDEAHCVSQWGHDFRPSYRRIQYTIRSLEKRPIIAAFTATATPLVKEDIRNLLGLYNPFELTSSFDRPNLYFEVRKPSNKLKEIEAYLRAHSDESGVIYCATRKNVDELCEKLESLDLSVTKYHAGLSEGERTRNQEDFLYDRKNVIVATNAFGMGIDKPNVRFVLHYNMPKNMEGYYQEAGRAGRDGESAECILLFGNQDIMTNRFLIENGGLGDHTNDYAKLSSMVDYCHTERCLRNYILEYFGQETLGEHCGKCGSCNNETEETDITVEAQKIMSCVKRMGERFGSTQVVDVLKGANTQKIRSFRFHELTTYGIMRDYAKEVIKELIAFLIAEGYLHLEGGQFPVLRLTVLSYAVLKGEKGVTIKRCLIKESETKKVAEDARERSVTLDRELYERLKQIRYDLAVEYHIQPFMVFPDTTLKEMSGYYPMTEENLLKVSGVGEHKLEKYGKYFIEAIKAYIKEKNIHIDFKESLIDAVSNKITTTKSAPRDSYKLTYELYRQGKELDEIADERNLTRMTIENHLLKCVEEGLEVDFNEFIPQEYEMQILDVIKASNDKLLKPIKEKLPDEVNYTAIKFTLAKYRL